MKMKESRIMAAEDLTLNRAIEILGINRARDGDLREMAMALGFHPWLNTFEENERRAAAILVLRRWDEYQRECNKRRDLKYGREDGR